jgi:hypothetical protein
MKAKIILLGIIVVFALTACTENKQDNSGAKLNISLTDAPAAANITAVNIDLQNVQINLEDDDQGWVNLDGVTPGIYDLLTLTAGAEELIASDYVPAGYYNQIRLVLGENNSITVKVNNIETTIPIKVPSGSTSGLKLNLHKELVDGTIYNVLLDFDAGKSIVAKGNGDFSLKPVIRMIMEETESGAIKGKVSPFDKQMLISLYDNISIEAIATVYTNITNGEFLIKGIEPGTYKIIVTPPTDSGFAEKAIENISVVKSQVTTVDPVVFP